MILASQNVDPFYIKHFFPHHPLLFFMEKSEEGFEPVFLNPNHLLNLSYTHFPETLRKIFKNLILDRKNRIIEIRV
jgi:DNA repair protein RadC